MEKAIDRRYVIPPGIIEMMSSDSWIKTCAPFPDDYADTHDLFVQGKTVFTAESFGLFCAYYIPCEKGGLSFDAVTTVVVTETDLIFRDHWNEILINSKEEAVTFRRAVEDCAVLLIYDVNFSGMPLEYQPRFVMNVTNIVRARHCYDHMRTVMTSRDDPVEHFAHKGLAESLAKHFVKVDLDA